MAGRIIWGCIGATVLVVGIVLSTSRGTGRDGAGGPPPFQGDEDQQPRSNGELPRAVPEGARRTSGEEVHHEDSRASESPSAAAAQPFEKPTVDKREWTRIVEGTAEALVQGSATLEDLQGLCTWAERLLDPSAGRPGPEGVTTFPLSDDPELGSASLILHPSQVGEAGEFELRWSMKAPVGGWTPEEAKGSQLLLSFGLGENGPAFMHASVQTEELAAHLSYSMNPPPFAASLHVSAEGSWTQRVDALVKPDGSNNGLVVRDQQAAFVGKLESLDLASFHDALVGLRPAQR